MGMNTCPLQKKEKKRDYAGTIMDGRFDMDTVSLTWQ